MKNMIFITFCIILLLPLCVLFSNNIKVENISLTGQNTAEGYTMVEFDISWDNSWKDFVNWDAAWVFVKYRDNNGLWRHAWLDISDANHNAPANSVINTGVNGSNATGVFIYRDSDGSGSNNWDNVQLRWNYGEQGLTDNALVIVKVFAIEMVYVPQGSFNLGDGSGGSTIYHFYDAGNGSSQPFTVNTQGSITTASSGSGNLWASGRVDAGTTDSNYPTGYNAFYCMKYEITQEQYGDFLNTLTRTQQNTRLQADISGTSVTNRYIMSDRSAIYIRNSICCDANLPASGPINIYCNYDGDGNDNEVNDGQNIACNFMNWTDGCAYACWAGLRPMTELEFEKACRGDQPAIAGEYAWGNINAHASAYTLTNAGSYNEVINGQPSGTGNACYSSTNGDISGPLRSGIFALSSTSRQEAGASYYGIMQLSGNLTEPVVTIGNNAGRTFTGNHGGGDLSINGNATGVPSWPGWDGNEVTSATGSGSRGGHYFATAQYLRVSHRFWVENSANLRGGNLGFRLVRSAP